MSAKSKISSGMARRVGAIAAAAILVIFGVSAVVKGLDGHATVHDALGLEQIVGEAQFTPDGIAAKAKGAGLTGVDLPTCSVAGKSIDTGGEARCFAQYMRIDALIATGGKTYAQMPRFATVDGKGTNVEAQALKADGRPVNNPARNVWVTETALSNALNTSYMAEQVSLFGIAVGAGFLLVAMALAAVALAGARVPRTSLAASRGNVAEPQPA